MHDQVCDHIKQRCPDTSLRAADIASVAQHIHSNSASGTRSLWRNLRGDADSSARQRRLRMLQSLLFDRVTTAEIGRRAGFSDASHFTRVVRRRTGQTPHQMRRARQV